MTEPTEKGWRIGISSEKRRSMAGAEYIRVIYGKEAQEFYCAESGEDFEWGGGGVAPAVGNRRELYTKLRIPPGI